MSLASCCKLLSLLLPAVHLKNITDLCPENVRLELGLLGLKPRLEVCHLDLVGALRGLSLLLEQSDFLAGGGGARLELGCDRGGGG